MTSQDLPLVSVLMPAYNHERYICEAIESVLAQTYENIELLIVDDGSTDSTLQLALSYASTPSVGVFSQPNAGLISTLKRLRSLARGKYVAILASDDIFYPEKISIMVALMECSYDAVMCIGRTDIIDASGVVRGKVKHEYRGERPLFDELLNGKAYVSSVSTLVRATTYRSVPYVDSYLEDLPSWLYISRMGNVLVTSKTVAAYRVTSSGLSASRLKMIRAERRIIRHYLESYRTSVDLRFPAPWCARWLKSYAIVSPRLFFVFLFSGSITLRVLFSLDFLKAIIYVFSSKLPKAKSGRYLFDCSL